MFCSLSKNNNALESCRLMFRLMFRLISTVNLHDTVNGRRYDSKINFLLVIRKNDDNRTP